MSLQQELKPEAETQIGYACCHHWIIQPAQGPVSMGQCQKCSEIREFNNFIEREDFEIRKQGVVS